MLVFPLSLQGLYVIAVYFVMHNQLCWPTKASYTVEMSGHDSPDSTYQGGGPTTVGGDISKSTQNLISAMEEVHTHTELDNMDFKYVPYSPPLMLSIFILVAVHDMFHS